MLNHTMDSQIRIIFSAEIQFRKRKFARRLKPIYECVSYVFPKKICTQTEWGNFEKLKMVRCRSPRNDLCKYLVEVVSLFWC